MTDTLGKVQSLAANGQVQISAHGYDQLAEDGILVREIMAGLAQARVVEDYPAFHKRPCVLVLQRDQFGDALHVVWGIAKGTEYPAVLVAAYRPDPQQWSDDFQRRAR
jgi:hypothetical protein